MGANIPPPCPVVRTPTLAPLTRRLAPPPLASLRLPGLLWVGCMGPDAKRSSSSSPAAALPQRPRLPSRQHNRTVFPIMFSPLSLQRPIFVFSLSFRGPYPPGKCRGGWEIARGSCATEVVR